MATESHTSTVCTELSYNDQLALVCQMSKSACARSGNMPAPPKPPDIEVAETFERVCARRLERLRKATREWIGKRGRTVDQDLDWPSFMLRPRCFSTFGSTDCLGVVAVDGVGALPRITTDLQAPVHSFTLAVCPKVSSYSSEGVHQSLFCEFQQLFDTNDSVSRVSVRESLPLVMFTRIHLSGLCQLGAGLLFQEALHKAIAHRISFVMDELASAYSELYTAEESSMDSVRCVLLDTLDWSNVALLLFGRNYSVLMTLIAGLRSLTMEDVYRQSADLASICSDPRISPLPYIAEIYRENYASAKNRPYITETLRDNHVFTAVYSTLGMTHAAMRSNEGYGGFVRADVHCAVSPGHWEPFYDNLKCALGKVSKPPEPVVDTLARLKRGDYVMVSVGKDDFVQGESAEDFSAQEESPREVPHSKRVLGELNSLTRVIEFRGQLLGGFFSSSHIDERGGRFTGDVTRFTTCLAVPVPRLSCLRKDVGRDHVLPAQILRATVHSLFGVPVPKSELAEAPLGVNKIDHLLDSIGAPDPVIAATRYLMCQFASALEHPQLFTYVLDLYEAFLCVPTLLESLKREAKVPGDKGPCAMDERDVEVLVHIISSLQTALRQRTQLTIQNIEAVDASVDLRGGLNQLLSATDVAMKCGVSFVRRLVQGVEGLKVADGQVGGISFASVDPRPSIRRIATSGKEVFLLGTVSTSVEDLTKPSALCAHIHEAAHMLLDAYRLRPDESGGYLRLGELPNERFREIHADMLVQRLIFDDDWELFLRYFVINFFLHPIANVHDRVERTTRVAEVLLRAFLITEPARMRIGTGSRTPHEVRDSTQLKHEASERLHDFLLQAWAYVHEFIGPWDGGLAAAICRDFISASSTPSFWSRVLECWHNVHQLSLRLAEAYFPKECERRIIEGEVNESLSQGTPVSRCSFPSSRSEDGFADAFFILRSLVRNQIERLYGEEMFPCKTRAVSLSHDEHGRADFSGKTGKPLNDVLLDTHKGRLYICNPRVGAKISRSRIVTSKSLWDISCNFRGRQLCLILRRLWYDDTGKLRTPQKDLTSKIAGDSVS